LISMAKIGGIIEGIVERGIDKNTPADESRCIRFINISAAITFFVYLFYHVFGLLTGDVPYIILSLIGCCVNLTSLYLNKRRHYLPARVIFLSYPCIYITFTWFYFGIDMYVPMFFLVGLMLAFLTFPSKNKKSLLFMVAFISACYTISVFAGLNFKAVKVLTPDQAMLAGNSVIFGSFACLIVLGLVLLRFLRRAEKELLEEKRKSEELLFSIIPPKVARILTGNRDPVAQVFENVTVIFAEIAGFDALSMRMNTEQNIDFLNRTFSVFDHLAEECGIHKIKTIGQIYMAAAGVPEPFAMHVEASADFALELLAVSGDLNSPDGSRVNLQIGIHTGPAVAGVIGRTRYQYDLWGDTINTSSRMMQFGTRDTIQVTGEVRRSLSEKYILEPRGDIFIKGKGVMGTWLLKGKSFDRHTSQKATVRMMPVVVGEDLSAWLPGKRRPTG